MNNWIIWALSGIGLISAAAYKEYKKKTKSAYIYIPLPENIAKYYPPKKEDSSQPHITILYIGKVPTKYKNKYENIVRSNWKT